MNSFLRGDFMCVFCVLLMGLKIKEVVGQRGVGFCGGGCVGGVGEALHGCAVVFAALRAIADGVADMPDMPRRRAGGAMAWRAGEVLTGHRDRDGGGHSDGFQPLFAADAGRRHGGDARKGAVAPDAALPYEVDGITGVEIARQVAAQFYGFGARQDGGGVVGLDGEVDVHGWGVVDTVSVQQMLPVAVVMVMVAGSGLVEAMARAHCTACGRRADKVREKDSPMAGVMVMVYSLCCGCII